MLEPIRASTRVSELVEAVVARTTPRRDVKMIVVCMAGLHRLSS
jgi:hypothetical protein